VFFFFSAYSRRLIADFSHNEGKHIIPSPSLRPAAHFFFKGRSGMKNPSIIALNGIYTLDPAIL
jgi:hypothetical protein